MNDETPSGLEENHNQNKHETRDQEGVKRLKNVKNSPKKIGINQSVLKLVIDQLKRREGEIKEFFNITIS